MHTFIIIQARMSSTRLPGKVILPVAGKPLIEYVVSRCNELQSAKTIIATSTDPTDEPIVNFCQNQNILYFRGNLTNVLDRYYETAKQYHAKIVIRVTSDCPLIDADLIHQGLEIFQRENCDYVSNTVERSYPRGFDFEIFTFNALEKSWKKALTEPEKEHVTPYIWKTHNHDFKIRQLSQRIDKSAYRITVDTPEDFQLIKILIEKYSAHTKNYQEIIRILDEHPELVLINKHIEQKKYGQ